MHETIVGFIRAGSFASVAAEAAGISALTFREWIARGEGRSERPGTEKHKRLAADVARARAEARLDAEVRVHRTQPTYWLSHAARTTQEEEGWTSARNGPGTEGYHATLPLEKYTDAELEEATARLEEAMFDPATYWSRPCAHARCRCPWHKDPAKR